MTGSFLRNSLRLILSLLILGFRNTVVFSQKLLSGNLNQPKAHVISMPAIPPIDRVTVDDVTGFSPNDTILIIQMQGVGINTPTTGYGYIQSVIGVPGLHEFMIIQSVNGGTNEIVFNRSLLNDYKANGSVQIVRVPYYNSAVVTSKLFCDPWNST